ncbi:tigger transposable element-derived protein 1-like [Trichomycterus rosablanca]|uniref:tigger transposable element-derived protein 1-like n=1 Tax=Trichomycterus rosablanca TaxID=2290929 RepID=UPI002F35BBD7
MQSAEEGHVTPVDLQQEGFQKKLIKKEEDDDDDFFYEGSIIPVVTSEEHLTPGDQQCGGFHMKPVKKEEPEGKDELSEGSIIPVEHVTSEEHLTPADQQCGGFQMKPVKKEEAEDKHELLKPFVTSPKRSAPSTASGAVPKRQRKMLTIAEKVKLLDMLKERNNYAAVGRHYGINESTVRYIKKDEKNIRSTAAVSLNQGAKRVVSGRNKAVVRMESALGIWIEDCRKKNIPVDTNIIREKAKKLYDRIVDAGDALDDDPQPGTSAEPPSKRSEFTASKGWFEKFKKRFNLASVNLHGEAASADKVEAEKYVADTFKAIIEEGGYRPEQVFNMDETTLFWKRMPSRTFIMKEEAQAPGFKAHKDRITLVMCGNAAGFMIKPGLIYKSKNPRALKNKNKNLLPVYWMHNPKAWITRFLTSDWFHQCFIPEVKIYLAEKGLEFKVLLLLDDAEGHPLDLSNQGVKIEFLPPNTTSLIQPMDQGVIRAFKALYTRNTLQNMVEAMDMDDDFSLKEYWRKYMITSCLVNVQKALNDMKKETVNACWKKLWPEVVHDYKGFSAEEIHHSAVDKAVRLAKLLGGEGFDDMTFDDINELLNAHSEPLSEEDLADMTKSASEEEKKQEDPAQEEDVGLSLERLTTILRIAKDLQTSVEEWDPQMIRSLQFRNALDDATEVYKNLLTQMKKQRQQLPITMFLTRKTPPSTPSVEEETPDKSAAQSPEEDPLEKL